MCKARNLASQECVLMFQGLLHPYNIVVANGLDDMGPALIPLDGVGWIVIPNVEGHHSYVIGLALGRKGIGIEIRREKNQSQGRQKACVHGGQDSAAFLTGIPRNSSYFRAVSRQRLFKKGTPLELEITDVAFGGKGIAKIETERGPYTVFVPNTITGQHVRARVSRCKSKWSECKLDEVLRRSPEEIDIPYQAIPGAPYATLPMANQHALKERTTLDVYERLGGIDLKADSDAPIYQGLIPSPESWHYRNKMEYSFAAIGREPGEIESVDGFFLGFKVRGTWWSVENMNGDGGLFDKGFEDALPTLRKYCIDSGLPPWHAPKREGFFRFLVVRKSLTEDRILIQLVTTSHGLEQFDLEGFADLCQSILGDRMAGFIHAINDDTGERVEARAGSTRLVRGDEQVTERVLGLDFKISMKSFFQTNPRCAEKLYGQALEYVMAPNDAEGEFMLDLFCGTGTIAQLLAQHTGRPVIGVDIVEDAIADARMSAEANGVSGITFHAADAGRFLLDHPEYKGKIHTVVLDPPRAGISPKSLRKVIRLGAPRMVYISCNPATQARDLATLQESGYVLKALKLVDQFPHTAHVEAVALLEAGGPIGISDELAAASDSAT
jgi:23S rRNA (uracil-5-)-methyltransferase RumA